MYVFCMNRGRPFEGRIRFCRGILNRAEILDTPVSPTGSPILASGSYCERRAELFETQNRPTTVGNPPCVSLLEAMLLQPSRSSWQHRKGNPSLLNPQEPQKALALVPLGPCRSGGSQPRGPLFGNRIPWLCPRF